MSDHSDPHARDRDSIDDLSRDELIARAVEEIAAANRDVLETILRDVYCTKRDVE